MEDYIKIKNISENVHVVQIPVDISNPHTIDLEFKDVNTGKGFAIGMSAEALMNVMIKHWDCDITLKIDVIQEVEINTDGAVHHTL